MKTINRLNIIILNLMIILIVTSCSSTKIERGKLIERNIKFKFDNCCLATNIKGSGKINLYEKKLIVKIKKGTIKINPESINKSYLVGYIYLSLGKYAGKKKGSWTTFNYGKKIHLNQKINSLNDSIDISSLNFEIPYNDKSDFIDSWIVITTSYGDGPGTNYSHSIEKKQNFTKRKKKL
jgi:hypothetical protein